MPSCQQEIDVVLPILAFGPSALYQLCFLSPTPRFYLGLTPGLSVHCYINTWFTPLGTGITITFKLNTAVTFHLDAHELNRETKTYEKNYIQVKKVMGVSPIFLSVKVTNKQVHGIFITLSPDSIAW